MKLVAVGPKQSNTGLGVAFQRHLLALRACTDVEEFHFGQSLPEAEIGYVHGGPTVVSNIAKAGRQIGYLVCESTELPKAYFRAATNLDEIWTCSDFCRGVLTQLNLPVKLVPHYTTQFESKVTNNPEPIFLVAFNGHSRILRKHPVLALRAIKLAGGQRVVIKAMNLTASQRQWLVNESAGLQVELIEEALSEEELLNLYRRIDIIVSLHASEGFGLHLLEAMGLGKCVVATKFGGNLQFMTKYNSYLVDADEVDTGDDYFPGQWGRPLMDSAVEEILSAIEDYNDASKLNLISHSTRRFNFRATVDATQASL